MITLAIQVPTESLSEVVQTLERADCRVEFMDAAPLEVEKRKWYRIICRRGPHSAAGCIIEPGERAERLVVGLSIDLRRLLWFWRLPGDQRLVRDLRDAILTAGGVLIENDT
jgi:hypothetical protein